ncbi:I78 family peptidase inhibitor [Marivivens sp. LCG002]|uniref:I78 family peptidase inhibitor n=1 Tax=Marivivens sp. LCG002 TaxID=3051171 RepID=UPI002555E76F|nr:I78 family peptidase inhibitor [Marivivens sp. LCG002]WIV50921.1 I78 family peptidase inhibitor [Marivivens sp. LCG002]
MRKFLVLPVFLAACSGGYVPPEAPASPQPASMPAVDTCEAANYAGLVGQPATELEKVLIMRMVRVIRPGDAVTMDMRAERINFEVSGEETIERIYCG